MYLTPEYFESHEIFPKNVYEAHLLDKFNRVVSNNIWRLMDMRVLWTADRLRELHGVMVVNDYMWGGNNQYRGYRSAIELLDINDIVRQLAAYNPGDSLLYKPRFSSFTSQHCLGQAIDCKFKYKSAEEIRQHIKANPHLPEYKYITRVEESVSWFHFDVANWDVAKNGILFFRP